MMRCPLTGCTRPAIIHPIYGVFPCSFHQRLRKKNTLPHQSFELTTEGIKEGRREYFKSTLQPFRHHIASKEFIEAYPEEAKQTFTEKEIQHAQYVWHGLPNWNNRDQTK